MEDFAMIPKQARLDILLQLFGGASGTRLQNCKIFLFSNNATVDADTVIGDLTEVTGNGFDAVSFLGTAWNTDCINSANQGEIDKYPLTFTASGSFSPFHIYGFAIRYKNDYYGGGGENRLYGVVKFTDAVPINAAGDKCIVNINVYADDYTPSGTCS